jgi:hypothetical protein
MPWTKQKGMTTDRAPSIIRKKTHLMDRIRQEMHKKSRILQGTLLQHPLADTVWKKFMT